MEKPHTGLDECPRILLSCFRARNSAHPPSFVVLGASIPEREREVSSFRSPCVTQGLLAGRVGQLDSALKRWISEWGVASFRDLHFCPKSGNIWRPKMTPVCGHRMAHRKWRETKLQPGTAGPGSMLGCCLVSFHFLWAILLYVHRLYFLGAS